MIVEFQFLEMLVEIIVSVQLQRYLCGDDIKYLNVQAPVEMVVHTK